MNVLLPISTPQQLLFIPRENTPTINFRLVNELLGDTTEYELSTSYNNGYMTVELSHPFNEGDNYSFEVFHLNGKSLYRGKIFVTAQTDLENYKTNPDFLYA